MSYILDALRRSQAERDRGQVPGLHAQAGPPVTEPRAAQARGLWWSGAALAAAVGALLWAWWWLQPSVHERTDAARLQAQAPPAPAPGPAPGPGLGLGPAPAPAPAQRAAAQSVPQPAPPPAALPLPLPRVVSVAPPVPAAVSAERPAPPAAAAASAAPRSVTLAELSPEQRRELPALAVGGSVWSDNSAGRFVLLNGQVVREGETIAPGLVLERIGRKSALLRWRALRIEVPL